MGKRLLVGTAWLCLAANAVAQSTSGGGQADPGHVICLDAATVNTDLIPSLSSADHPFEVNRPYVMQLHSPLDPSTRSDLEDAGVVLGDYLPKNAFIVDLSEADPAELATLPAIRWIGEYRKAWKLDPKCGQRHLRSAGRRSLATQGLTPIVLTLFEGHGKEGVLGAIRALDDAVVHGTHVVAGNETISATVPSQAITELTDHLDVQYVEEAPEITLRNTTNRWIVQSNIQNVTPLYDNGLHGEGQIVGVIDSRVDQHHCSLDGGKILFYNTTDGDDQHGTHVSCTAVGDSGGPNNRRGIAYLASMVYNRVPFVGESIISHLDLHHGQGARIHNNSWGDDGTTSYNSLTRGYDSFLYDNEDDVVCIAVTNLTTLRNPENAKNAIAVGACGDSPNQFSHCRGGTGPTADGRRKPEIFAPGCNTQSANTALGGCSEIGLTGTSYAAPAISGTAALIRQYYVDGYFPSGAASAADGFVPSGALIKATLLNSAVDMTGISGFPSNQEGWGRVLADNALYFPGDTRALSVLADIRNANGLSTGAFETFYLSVTDDGEPLKITLVWTDPPASAGTGTGLAAVNDLDLEVRTPDGTLYRGNVFSSGVSMTGGSADTLNNVEQVLLTAPEVGIWTIGVRATSVNVGTQGFALMATGAVLPQPLPLVIRLPDGAPTTMLPGRSVDLTVEVLPGTEMVILDSPELHYRQSGGAFETMPLLPVNDQLYKVILPGAGCDDTPEFYFSAKGHGGALVFDPPDAPNSVYAPVVETVNPICPGNVVRNAAAGACGADLNLPAPIHCDADTIVNDYNGTNDASDFYPVGETTVTWTVTEIDGTEHTCFRRVTVHDREPPVVTCPPDRTLTADGSCATVPDLTGDLTVDDNCDPNPTRTQAPEAGTVIPPGPTIVTMMVQDLAGNTTLCDVTITVADTTAPIITACPGDRAFQADGNGEATIPDLVAEITATDNCAAAVTITQDPPAGTAVGLGVTAVTLTVTDDAGNFTTCAASITTQLEPVTPSPGPGTNTGGNTNGDDPGGDCGTGACGPPAAMMMPLTLLGLSLMRRKR